MKKLLKKQKIIGAILIILALVAIWFTWQMLTATLVNGPDGVSLPYNPK